MTQSCRCPRRKVRPGVGAPSPVPPPPLLHPSMSICAPLPSHAETCGANLGKVSLFEGDNSISHVPSPEVHAHRRPCPFPPRAPFNWARLCSSFREIHSICPGFFPPVVASVHVHLCSLAFPCWDMRCKYRDAAAISSPQSPHVTLSLFRSLGDSPLPVIVCVYDFSDLFPAALHGRQAMLTVFASVHVT